MHCSGYNSRRSVWLCSVPFGRVDTEKAACHAKTSGLNANETIVFAIGFASVLLSITTMLGWFNPSHLSIKAINLGVLIGGLIFGIGFASVGTCPGTCVAATGSGGFRKAIFAVVSGLAGAFVFSVTYGFIKDLELFDTMNFNKLTWFNISDKYDSVFSFDYTGLLIVGLLFIAAAFLLPSKSEE